MPVQTPFNPSRSFTFQSCSSNRLSLPTMARRPIVGGNWKCNPDSFSKLDDLIKIMKLEPTKERGCCWWNPWGTPLGDKKLASKFQMEMDGWQHIPELYKQNLQHAQFHRVTFSSIRNECDTSACDVFVCPSPLHVAYVASKVKDSELWNFCIGMCVWKSKIKHNLLHLASFLYVFMYVCSGEHPRVRPELWLQRLWRFHRRNRRGAIEGAPVSTPIRFNPRADDFRNIASMNLRVFILKSAGAEHIALPIGNTWCRCYQDLKIQWVLLGHSERREYFTESNELLAQKLCHGWSNGIPSLKLIYPRKIDP